MVRMRRFERAGKLEPGDTASGSHPLALRHEKKRRPAPSRKISSSNIPKPESPINYSKQKTYYFSTCNKFGISAGALFVHGAGPS